MKNGLVSRPTPLAISLGVLGQLDRHEGRAEPHCEQQPVARGPRLTGARRGGSARSGPATRHQYDRVQSGEAGIERRLPRREHRRADGAGYGKCAQEQTERGEFTEDQHPHHGIAGQVIENAPADLLLFVICCRHLVSG